MSKASRLKKFAKSGSVKVTTYNEWDYELNDHGRPLSNDVQWVPEDDERSASWKAKGKLGTGYIRSREVTLTVTTTPKGKVTEALDYSGWIVKEQGLV